MTKKLIAFDLDDTLAVTKSPISDRMGELLVKLMDSYDICIISGGKFELFQTQVVERLEATPQQLARLHLMPTCGTRYYRYEQISKEWQLQYAEDLTVAEKKEITEVLESSAKELGIWDIEVFGDRIEDRQSQITYSVLGQLAPAEKKYEWATKNTKVKQELREMVAKRLLSLEVRLGGTTSVDVTRIGVDKAYGMQKLIEALDISKEDVLFVGDKLNEGGNDYPVLAMGIDSIEVEKWQDTAFVLDGITSVS